MIVLNQFPGNLKVQKEAHSDRMPLHTGSCHKRQKPQAPIRNRQTRKVANAKGLNRNTNLT